MSNSTSDIDNHISKKYEIRRRLGKGAYGVVWKANDRRNGTVIAVKKIFDAFRNRTDAQRTFREIVFLKEFSSHPNVVRLLNVHRAANDKDLYLVFEFMETDLHHVIKKGNILKEIHRQYIIYQLFKATKYLHSGNVIHRDQKPSNILLDSQCNCKLADFGLARSLSIQDGVDTPSGEGDACLTDYVATRWYRAPEILLASKKYTKGVDMWSLGCILAEMLLSKPLFPGTSTINQIEKIVTTVALPSPKNSKELCSDYAQSILEKAHTMKRRSLVEVMAGASGDAVQLVEALLLFNPAGRMNAHDALKHRYVARFHNPAQEPEMNRDVIPPLSDDIQLSVDQYRSKLYDIIREEKLARKLKQEGAREERERRASSHELEEGRRRASAGAVRETVRKVHSEVNVRGEGGGLLPGRRGVTATVRSSHHHEGEGEKERSKSLKETLKQSMTTGYCYRASGFLKNKS